MDPTPSPTPAPPARRPGWTAGLTRNVFVLGLVSLFTDISSEMIVPVRILFLVGVLGTPLPLAGLIEGMAESTGQPAQDRLGPPGRPGEPSASR